MWKRAVCAKDCPDTCGLLVRVENGRIVAVKGDPEHPYTQGFICRKGSHFPAHVHGGERITTPLKRVGAKGSGEFVPISWDEALDTVAGRMRSVVAESGSLSILPYFYAGHMGLVHRRCGDAFFNRLGASTPDLTICSAAASAGFAASLGKGPSTAIEEAAKADCIIIWGSNTRTTNIHAWPHFAQARRNGARILVIDPYRNSTAEAADEHFMLRPGTDAALALGMMHVLIREGLVDRAYVERMSVGYDALRREADAYPPERVADICDIPAARIEALALEYGRARAPYIRTGWGPARQLAGGMAMRTIALLPVLVNAFARPGGGITRSLGGAPGNTRCLERPDLRPCPPRVVNMVELGNALTGAGGFEGPPIQMLYVYLSNPAVVAPQSRLVLEGLAREDLFTVVQEMYLTDTARYADIILPGASFLEVADLYRAYGHNYIQQAEPVIPPVGECRSTLDIFQALAARMGFDEPVFRMTEQEFIDCLLAEDASGYLDGVDLGPLREGRAVRLNIPSNPYADGFGTPSGKAECFSASLAAQGLPPVPVGDPVRDPEGEDRYPLECLTPPHHLMLNSAFNEIPSLLAEAGSPSVFIHPETAAARGIVHGDRVRVFNGRGECFLAAEVTDRTRTDVLVIEGLRWSGGPAGCGANQLTSQRLTDMGRTCAFHCSLVDVEPCA